MTLRGVLFDLDGTLWGDAPGWAFDNDLARASAMATGRLARLFQQWGISHDPREFVEHFWAFARARENVEAVTLRAPAAASLAREAATAKGLELTPAQAASAWTAMDLPATQYGRALYPDTAATLQRLHTMGLAIAVVSNRMSGPGMLRADFAGFGINNYVDAIVCSADVGYRKPHRIIFQRALQALGLPPSGVVMVGDNFENDVRGAKALGITAVLKSNGRELSAEEEHESDFVIEHLLELFAVGLL